MKLIKLFFLALLVACSSNGQHICKVDDILNDFLMTNVSYSIDQEYVDLTTVFKDNQTIYLGFIGANKKKMEAIPEQVVREQQNMADWIIQY